MIHQFIFAAPKPGLSAEAFQSYWVNFHAVEFAAKIPQIQQYLVATRVRVPSPCEVPSFEGVAEIWLASEEEQLASMQTPEFLQGARLDEPRWAAFWQTLVLDTDPVVTQACQRLAEGSTKVYVLLKRRPGMELDEFRDSLVDAQEGSATRLPCLEGSLVGLARRALYSLGEPRFDAVEVWWFRAPQGVRDAFTSEEFLRTQAAWHRLVDERYLFTFVGQEHWIIRPGER